MSTAGFVRTILAQRPFSVLIQVTNRCNLTCPFCDFWPNGDLRAELSLADYQRLAAALAEVGTMLVSIEGGEPLIRPDLPEIIQAFSAQGHLPVLYTNGWFLDEARAAAVLQAGVHQVGISIDFPDAARHDAMRGAAGTWARAVAAVERLRPALGRRLHILSVLMQENQADVEALLQLSARLGVLHHFTLLSDHGFRRGTNGHRPDALPPLGALAQRYPHLRTFRSYLNGIHDYLAQQPLPRCRAGLQSFNVDHRGQVAPCIERIHEPVGTIRDTPLPVLLQRLAARDAGAGCQDCWTLCRGTAQAMGQRGTLKDWADLGRM